MVNTDQEIARKVSDLVTELNETLSKAGAAGLSSKIFTGKTGCVGFVVVELSRPLLNTQMRNPWSS